MSIGVDGPQKVPVRNRVLKMGDRVLNIALQIDSAVKTQRPDSWRGVHAREQVVKRAIYGVVNSEDVVERIFPVLKQQAEY